MISKIIHYTWFSGEEMPSDVKRCMESWRKIMPEYELRKWDMESLKEIDSVFLKEALQERKWAYAADFVRLYAVYHYGGIYLDTDVQVYKPFDRFLQDKAFIGKESSIHFGKIGSYQGLSSHCFGAEKGHPFIKSCLDYYQDRHFITSSIKELPNELRQNIVTLPFIQALIGNQIGYNWNPSFQQEQSLEHGLKIYPAYFFDPFQGKTVSRSKSYCLHLAVGSWRENYSCGKTKNSLVERLIIRVLGSIFHRMHYCLIKFS